MEPARAVKARWEIRAPNWAPLFPEPAPVAKSLLPGTDDDDLAPLSLIATQAERALWSSIMEAWRITASHVDLTALVNAARRESALDLDRLLLPRLSATLMWDRIVPRLQTMFRHGVEHADGVLRNERKQLSTDASEPYRAAAAWAQEHAGRLITHITERQREAVRDLIAEAFSDGITPDEVARLLRLTIGLRPDQNRAAIAFRRRLVEEGVPRAQVRERTLRYRGALQRQRTRMIARTELITAANAGQMALWREGIRTGQLPRVPYKRWIVTEDERLCPMCEALGEMDPIPLEQEFLPGVLAPSAHPNCRCAVALVPNTPTARGQGLLMPRGGGIIAQRGMGFDPLARVAAHAAAGFWDAIASRFSVTNTPGIVLSSDVVTEGVSMMLDTIGIPRSDYTVNPFVNTYDFWGQWTASTKTLSLDEGTSKDLLELFTEMSVLGTTFDGPRKRAMLYTPAYSAVHTVLHEAMHILSGFNRDNYRTGTEKFMEEGLVELRSRRITASLVFGKKPLTERLRGYRAQGGMPLTYEPYVAPLRWYEKRVGGKALRELHELPPPHPGRLRDTSRNREAVAVKRLAKYLGDYATRWLPREDASRIRRHLTVVDTRRILDALRDGTIEAMAPAMGTSPTDVWLATDPTLGMSVFETAVVTWTVPSNPSFP